MATNLVSGFRMFYIKLLRVRAAAVVKTLIEFLMTGNSFALIVQINRSLQYLINKLMNAGSHIANLAILVGYKEK